MSFHGPKLELYTFLRVNAQSLKPLQKYIQETETSMIYGHTKHI